MTRISSEILSVYIHELSFIDSVYILELGAFVNCEKLCDCPDYRMFNRHDVYQLLAARPLTGRARRSAILAPYK